MGDADDCSSVTAQPAVAWSARGGRPRYGLEVARTLARELAACGVPVVSGMALGVDSAAHEGALEGGGLTVAVLAGGADVAVSAQQGAPAPAHRERGLVLSEMPPGFKPLPLSFPARNRIMAGPAA